MSNSKNKNLRNSGKSPSNNNLSVHNKPKKPIKRKVKKQPNYSGTFVMGVFFIVVIIYLGRSVYSVLTKPKIPSIVVQMGTVDSPILLDGIIIRDEKAFSTSANGVVNFYYNDLERVKIGSIICSIQDQEEYLKQKEDLLKLDSDILSMQDRRGNMSAFQQDAITFNNRIRDYIENKVYLGINDNISKIYDLKENISQNINVRNQMLLSENRGSVKNLVDKKQTYEAELKKAILDVGVDVSGILSYTVDGLEDTYNFTSIKDLAAGQVLAQGNPKKIVNEKKVFQNEELFRIVKSNEWYIASYIPIGLISDWTEDMIKTVYIQTDDGYVSQETTVTSITKSEKTAYVVFRSTKNIIDYIDNRNIKFKITDSEHKGYKIPSSAIINKTFLKIPNEYIFESSTLAVVKRTSEKDIIQNITARNRNQDHTYVLQDFNILKYGDILVKEGQGSQTYTISEIENRKGVYIINNGYTEFKEIVLNSAIPENNTHIILDPKLNPHIKIFDRIISDAKNITENQKVY